MNGLNVRRPIFLKRLMTMSTYVIIVLQRRGFSRIVGFPLWSRPSWFGIFGLLGMRTIGLNVRRRKESRTVGFPLLLPMHNPLIIPHSRRKVLVVPPHPLWPWMIMGTELKMFMVLVCLIPGMASTMVTVHRLRVVVVNNPVWMSMTKVRFLKWAWYHEQSCHRFSSSNLTLKTRLVWVHWQNCADDVIPKDKHYQS